MWSRFKAFWGINSDDQYFDGILCSIHQEAINRYFFFHLLILGYEILMAISISLRAGGPFIKPRRSVYFFLYMILILITVCVILTQAWVSKQESERRLWYFRIENAYVSFFCLWGVAVTLNDQLGGNGLTVFNYVILLIAIMAVMKPWQSALLFTANFILLNALLPYFPDPAGLDNRFNNFMNSLFLVLAAIMVASILYNSKIRAKKDEIIIKKQYQQIEESNKLLSKEALFDVLTGLQNRNSFNKVTQALEDMNSGAFACIYIDVNGLHEINNYLGHQAGDTMLKVTANILLNNFCSEDVFRIGGDEFVILCNNAPYETVSKGIECIQKDIDEAGYSFSVGFEWRDCDIDIPEIIQTAEAAMRKQKREYYQTHGGDRQKQVLNERLANIISANIDTERFLSVIAPVFKGVYFVNLETDTLRQIFIPPYFQEMLGETGGQYSKALLLYARQLVKPQYVPLFEKFCDYGYLENVLAGDDIPGFTYQKKDGEMLMVRVLKFNCYPESYKETLWIFSEAEAGEHF